MKTITRYELRRTAVVALVVLILLLSFASYFTGSIVGSTTVTIASTTETVTINTTDLSTVTETVTESSLTVKVNTEFLTVTEVGPPTVQIDGTAITKQVGTTAESVIFVSASNNATFLAKVVSGRYSVDIPNHDAFNVYIEFITAVSVGGGRCSAGGAWVNITTNQTQTFNVSC